jgi:hypothetical protein
MPVSNIFLGVMLILVAIIGFRLLRRYDQAEKEAIRKACKTIAEQPRSLSPRLKPRLAQHVNKDAETICNAKKNSNFFDVGYADTFKSETSAKPLLNVQYDWTAAGKAAWPNIRHDVRDKEMAAVSSCHDCA